MTDYTPILHMPEVASNQDQKEATINTAIAILEAASNEAVTVDLTAANVTLNTEQFTRAFFFQFTGHTVPRTVTVPNTPRWFAVENKGSASVTLRTGAAPLLSVELPPNRIGLVVGDGSELRFVVPDTTAGMGLLRDLSDVDGLPTNGQLLRFDGPSATWKPWSLSMAFTQLTDTPASLYNSGGMLLGVNDAGTRLEFVTSAANINAFTELEDTPSSYAGAANRHLIVNAAGTGVTFSVPYLRENSDFPNTYSGQAGRFLRVNSAANGVVFDRASLSDLTDGPGAPAAEHALKYPRLNAAGTALEWVDGSGGPVRFIELYDTPSAYTGAAGLIPRVNVDQTQIIFSTLNFTELAGTPTSFSGSGGMFLRVNAGGSGVVFGTVGIQDLVNGPGNLASSQAKQVVRVNNNKSQLEYHTLSLLDLAGVSDMTGAGGMFLKVNPQETGVEYAETPFSVGFTGLTDTPNNYSGNSGKFVAVNSSGDGLVFVTPPSGGGGGGASALGELTDVELAGPGSGDVLTFRDNKWIAEAPQDVGGAIQMSELTDVDFTGANAPAENEVLTYKAGRWSSAPAASVAVPQELEDLTDVVFTTTPVNGYILTHWDGEWVAAPPVAVAGDALRFGEHRDWRVLFRSVDPTTPIEVKLLAMRAAEAFPQLAVGGTAAARDNAGLAYNEQLAFDADNATYWRSGGLGPDGTFLRYTFAEEVEVNHVTLMFGAARPANVTWYVQFSDDGGLTWVTAWTHRSIVGWVANETFESAPTKAKLSFTQLSDSPGPMSSSAGAIIRVNAEGTALEYTAPQAVPEVVDDLNDVEINNVLEGQVITYVDGKWVNADPSTDIIPELDLGELQDVTLPAVIPEGTILAFRAGRWRAVGPQGRYGAYAYWRVSVSDTTGNPTTTTLALAEVQFRASPGGAQAATGGAVLGSGGSLSNAFDGVLTTDWTATLASTPWIGYQFNSPIEIAEVALRVSATGAWANNYAPEAFKVQYSPDGTVWYDAWAVEAATGWQVSEERTFARPGLLVRFLDSIDTPATYAGQAGKLVGVNAAETGLEFIELDPDTLEDLADTDVSSPANGDVLTFDAVSGTWTNQTPALGGGIDDLNDVEVDTPQDRDFLVYDELTEAWINASVTFAAALGDLTDVTFTTPAAGQVVRHDGTKWINGALSFLQLSDTPNNYTSQEGKYLRVNAGGTGLEFTTAPSGGGGGGGATLLAELDDVDVAGAEPGNLLMKSASGDWMPAELPEDNGDWILLDVNGDPETTHPNTWAFERTGATPGVIVRGTDKWDDIKVVYDNVAASVSAFRFIRVSTDNGSTFDGGNNYRLNGIGSGSTFDLTSGSTADAVTTSAILLGVRGADNYPRYCVGDVRGNAAYIGSRDDINAILVAPHTGTATSGNIRVYGRLNRRHPDIALGVGAKNLPELWDVAVDDAGPGDFLRLGTNGKWIASHGTLAEGAWEGEPENAVLGWEPIHEWSGSIDPAVPSITIDVTEYTEVTVTFAAVGTTAASWRGVRYSTDGGLTFYDSGVYNNNTATGASSVDDMMYSHSTSASAARSAAIHIQGTNVTGPKTYCTQRDANFGTLGSYGQPASLEPITHIQIIARVATSENTNFTSGNIFVAGFRREIEAKVPVALTGLVDVATGDASQGDVLVYDDGVWSPRPPSLGAPLPTDEYEYWRVAFESNFGDVYHIAVGELEMRGEPGGPSLATGGSAFGAGSHGASYPFSAAFDGDPATYWLSPIFVTTNQWLAYRFPEPVNIVEIAMSRPAAISAAYMPRKVRLEYSVDGVNWQVRFRGEYPDNWPASQLMPLQAPTPQFGFLNLYDVPATYSGYEGKALMVNDTGTGLKFNDLNPNALGALLDVEITTPLTYGEGLLYDGAKWTNVPAAAYGRANYGEHRYWRIVVDAVQYSATATQVSIAEVGFHADGQSPTLTTGGTPLGTGTTAARARAFDGNPTTYWEVTADAIGSFIGYDFGGPVNIGYVTVRAGNPADRSPSVFTVQYSDNAVNWNDAWQVDAATWASGIEQGFYTDSVFRLTDLQGVRGSYNLDKLKYLRVNAAGTGTEFHAPSLIDLADVTTAGVTEGHVLTYGSAGWYPASPVTSLEALADVTLATPGEGQFLRYVSGNWINADLPPGLGGALSINDIEEFDLVTNAPENNDVLVFDNGMWYPRAVPPSPSIYLNRAQIGSGAGAPTGTRPGGTLYIDEDAGTVYQNQRTLRVRETPPELIQTSIQAIYSDTNTAGQPWTGVLPAAPQPGNYLIAILSEQNRGMPASGWTEIPQLSTGERITLTVAYRLAELGDGTSFTPFLKLNVHNSIGAGVLALLEVETDLPIEEFFTISTFGNVEASPAVSNTVLQTFTHDVEQPYQNETYIGLGIGRVSDTNIGVNPAAQGGWTTLQQQAFPSATANRSAVLATAPLNADNPTVELQFTTAIVPEHFGYAFIRLRDPRDVRDFEWNPFRPDYTLGDLTDVTTTGASEGDGLALRDGEWVAEPLPGIGKGTEEPTQTGGAPLSPGRLYLQNSVVGADLYISSEGATPTAGDFTQHQVFTATGADQRFIVPAGITELRVKMWGAGGGAGLYNNGHQSGAGGYTEAVITVTPGEELRLQVPTGGRPGQPAQNAQGGWPDGGKGSYGDTSGGGGGGSARLWRATTLLAVAGGGGASAGYSSSAGAGGGLAGQNAVSGSGGTGGTQTEPGVDASDVTNLNKRGGFLRGGNGGPQGVYTTDDGGAGGGGYYGGGGGGGDGSPGGGGSGYLNGAVVDPAYPTQMLTGDRATPPNVSDPYYTAGIAVGAPSTNNAGLAQPGGDGLIVIEHGVPALSWDRLLNSRDIPTLMSNDILKIETVTSVIATTRSVANARSQVWVDVGPSQLTVNVPLDLSVTQFPVGASMTCLAAAATMTRFTADPGVTLLIPGGKKAELRSMGSTTSLLRIDLNSWVLIGDLADE